MPPLGSAILLPDYLNAQRLYALDPARRTLTLQPDPALTSPSPVQGWACEIGVGILRPHPHLFALYQLDGLFYLYAEGEVYSLKDDLLMAKRSTHFFHRSFTLATATQKRRWIYRTIDWVEDEPYIRDFFWQVEREFDRAHE